MRKLAFRIAVTVPMDSGAAAAIKALTPSASTAPQPNLTIAIEEIHWQVDVKSLPGLEVKDPI